MTLAGTSTAHQLNEIIFPRIEADEERGLTVDLAVQKLIIGRSLTGIKRVRGVTA